MVSEEKIEEIRKEAKNILDSFSKKLEGVELGKVDGEKELKSVVVGFREEGKGEKMSKEFRKRMFENAPEVEGDCIIAEKKKW